MAGLYKDENDINDGSGRSVLYAHAGKMLGGNTAFAHFGTYEIVDGEIVARLRTKRHSRSPQHRSLVSSDAVTISIRGRPQGKLYRFESVDLEGGATAWTLLLDRELARGKRRVANGDWRGRFGGRKPGELATAGPFVTWARGRHGR